MTTETNAAAAEATTETKAAAPLTTRQHLIAAAQSITPEEKKTVAKGLAVLGVGVLIGVLAS